MIKLEFNDLYITFALSGANIHSVVLTPSPRVSCQPWSCLFPLVPFLCPLSTRALQTWETSCMLLPESATSVHSSGRADILFFTGLWEEMGLWIDQTALALLTQSLLLGKSQVKPLTASLVWVSTLLVRPRAKWGEKGVISLNTHSPAE